MNENLPVWLRDWNPAARVSMSDFFASRVVFYPGSGTDGQPVQFFGTRHAAHCFVYADYGITRDHVRTELGEGGHPFAGYRRAGHIDLLESDLAPNGWTPHIRPEVLQHPLGASYAFVEILERRPGFGEAHGPKRLAILFICADGVAAYDALFCQTNRTAPYAVVIQDHGFGDNWTKFGGGGYLESLASITGQLPQFLLVASNTDAWGGYSAIDGATLGGGGMHGFERQLWRRADHAGETPFAPRQFNTEAGGMRSALAVDDQPSAPEEQQPDGVADADQRFSASELFFMSIEQAHAATALVAHVLGRCEELQASVHHTYTNGGDLRVRADRPAPSAGEQNVITMAWKPARGHFYCLALASPEECVVHGLPPDHVRPNAGALASRLRVTPGIADEAFLSIVSLSIQRFREQ